MAMACSLSVTAPVACLRQIWSPKVREEPGIELETSDVIQVSPLPPQDRVHHIKGEKSKEARGEMGSWTPGFVRPLLALVAKMDFMTTIKRERERERLSYTH
jgi:hypothetical protein